MAVVPPRQVAFLSVANYDDICESAGLSAGTATIDALKRLAVDCGVDPGYMRTMRKDILLLRLDDLPREDFIAALERMSQGSQELAVPELTSLRPKVRVGAISERAMRSLVNDATLDLLAYMNHADSSVALLAGDELDQWHELKTTGIEFLSHEQLKYLDSFTGMLTLERFLYLVQHLLDNRSIYGNDGMAIIYFDIDDFKSFNRTYSFDEGNRLLKFVAKQIQTAFDADVVAHISVDRYAVLTNSPDLVRKCASIHKATRRFNRSFAPELKCGIYAIDDFTNSSYVALDCAKLACESIKGRYDVACRYFGDEHRERFFTRRFVARHAEQAVGDGWIKAFAQPVVRTDDGELCGFEALARWDDPERGLLSPAMFIPTLEDAHLINKLDICIVDQVCQHLEERLSQGLPCVPASINLSRLDFGLCDILKEVSDCCERHRVPHGFLAVEITESALQSGSNLRKEMDRFREMGFEVWMDDFGCGYSSLNLLKDYDFDVLKVDMEFLRDMENNERSKKILLSVLEMARNLGIRTLVEGVETTTQRDFLRKAGCDMMQGYLFGRPQPLEYAEL